jgi:hypothetical protein
MKSRNGLLTTILLCGLGVPTYLARADEIRPSADAELLMLRYASGGSQIIFNYPGTPLPTKPPMKLPDIALYSDGTVLISEETYDSAQRRMRMSVIPADVAIFRYQSFSEDLAHASPTYRYNCWNSESGSSRRPHNCVDDASTAIIALKLPGSNQFKAIAVAAGYEWRHVSGMRDFVPPAYFDLMAWMDGLHSLPSQLWPVPDQVIPGLAISDPACVAATELCD